MAGAIALDVETTDVDAPDVIELAWLPLVTRFEPSPASLLIPGLPHDLPGGWFRFRPRKPITLGAMAAHHIIEDDLVDQPEWSGSWELPGGTAGGLPGGPAGELPPAVPGGLPPGGADFVIPDRV